MPEILPPIVDSEKVMMRSFGAFGLPITVLIDPQRQYCRESRRTRRLGFAGAVAYFKRITGT